MTGAFRVGELCRYFGQFCAFGDQAEDVDLSGADAGCGEASGGEEFALGPADLFHQGALEGGWEASAAVRDGVQGSDEGGLAEGVAPQDGADAAVDRG
ncbi:hypothetical protein ACRJ4W_07810 [Streptomyces sp. GLT-R25]